MTKKNAMMFDWKVWLGFAISAAAVYFTFRNEDFGKIFAAMKSANWLILLLSIPVMISTILLRAWRWKYFIKSDTTSLRAKYNAVNIGFLATNIFPLRLGELVRVLVFARRSKRSRIEIFATIAVERFFDVIAIIILFVLVLPHIPLDAIRGSDAAADSVYYKYSPHTMMVWSIGIVLSSFAGFLLLCHYGRRVSHWFTERFDIRHPFLMRIIASLFDGLEALWHSRTVLPALLASIFLWFSVAFNFWVTLMAFPSGSSSLGAIIGISGSVFLDTVLCFGVAAPSAPGFVGVWQFATKAAFIPYPQADNSAVLAFGILVFLLQYFLTIGIGLACLKSEGMSLSDVKHVKEVSGEDVEPKS